MNYKVLLVLLFSAASLTGTEFKPITIRPDYQHDRWVTKSPEIVRYFEAFTTSFDSKDDDGEAW